MEANDQISKWIYPEADKIMIDPKSLKKPFLTTKYNKAVGVVLHHTVSSSLKGTADFFCNPTGAVGIHFLVGSNGEIWQLSEMNKMATHAGAPWTSKTDGKYYDNVNKSFIGIEAVNLGPLLKQKDNTYQDYWKQTYKGPVRERYNQLVSEYRYWEPFTKKQEESIYKLVCWLIKRWEINIDDVIGHYECSPTRKNDPFGGFEIGDMKSVRDKIRNLLK